jgi:transcriptional regulator with XRE-family HTH domain
MKNLRRNVLRGGGQRLKEIRSHLDLTKLEMARKLGVDKASYYKNEYGKTFPSMASLKLLQKDHDISMDWLLFEKGPMFYREKGNELTEAKPGETQLPAIVENTEVKELLAFMEKDPKLKHKIMLHFYEYKEEKGNPAQETDSTGQEINN